MGFGFSKEATTNVKGDAAIRIEANKKYFNCTINYIGVPPEEKSQGIETTLALEEAESLVARIKESNLVAKKAS